MGKRVEVEGWVYVGEYEVAEDDNFFLLAF